MLTVRRGCVLCGLIIYLGCLGGAATAGGQTPAPNPALKGPQAVLPGQEEADHEALRAIKAAYEQAVNDAQFDRLAPYLHPDFFAVMVTNAPVHNVEEMRAYWQRMKALIGDGGRYTTKLNPERSVILGDIALARGTSDDVVVTSEGREYHFSTNWTVVCQRVGGQWKVLRGQGTMDPITNQFAQTFARRATVQGSVIGGAIGVALGWLFATVFRRFKARRAAA